MLRDQIHHLRVLWILVDANGGTRVGVPMHALRGHLAAFPREAVVEVALQQAVPFIDERSGQGDSWIAVVSVLRRDVDAVRLVHEALPGNRSRELDDNEYAALVELGMDVPLGDWADRTTAEIFLLR